MSDMHLPVYTRIWPDTPLRRTGAQTARPIDQVIVFDTETTIDPSQRLNFGCFRYYKRNPFGAWTFYAEGLIYADDLPVRDPDGFATLQRHTRTHKADTGSASHGVSRDLLLVSRAEFANKYLHDKGYRHKKYQGLEPATIVGFNLPFDLSRLAVDVGEARKGYAGGFSFTMFTRADGRVNWHRPRIAVKSLGAHKTLIGFTGSKTNDGYAPDGDTVFRGNFVDLHTLVFALTDRSHSLKSAGETFGCEQVKSDAEAHGKITDDYITYCRQDVAATYDLYEKVMAEYERHPFDKPASAMFSGASVSKAYYDAMGITPPLARPAMADFPREILGYAMASFYGGRAEVHIRNTPLPVSHNDFTSMYPTVNALMGLWELLTDECIQVVDATNEVNALLESISIEEMLNPGTWRHIVSIAEIVPDGNVLPVRAEYDDGSHNIGINRLVSEHPLWYTVPDLISAKLLGQTVPQVRRAYKFVGIGRQLDTLRPVDLRGQVKVNPATDDFFVKVVEVKQQMTQKDHAKDCACDRCRVRASSKVLANAGSYGIFSEFVRRPPSEPLTHLVYGAEPMPWEHTSDKVEEPGAYCFPPLSTLITGAARLMLTILERLVTDAGGTWILCDTDSMAIVADEHGSVYPCDGGPEQMPDGQPAVRALTYRQVREIRDRFRDLIPYSRELVPDLIVEEFRGRCLAISAKRYALYTVAQDGIDIVKTSEHGLGHLLSPVDQNSEDKNWRRQWWTPMICEAEGIPWDRLAWLDRPAMSRITVSNTVYYRSFTEWNRGKSYGESVKPFNFILTPHVFTSQNMQKHPAVSDKFRLIAPYEQDATTWLDSEYWNMYDRTTGEYRVTGERKVAPDGDHLELVLNADDPIPIETYGDIYYEYKMHPERKYNGPNGWPCARHTKGMLSRRTVRLLELHHIGKESEFEDERAAGLMSQVEATIDYTPNSDKDKWRKLVMPVLDRRYTPAELGAMLSVTDRQIRRIRQGASNPSAKLKEQLETLAVKEARKDIAIVNPDLWDRYPQAVLIRWAEMCGSARTCARCGKPVTGKAKYCGATCRQAASRAKKANR
ncbi:hypothetical protein [Amycolatopsis dongchuanensis]|uniref:hypothetical protein n=1 Tax=Amycolatopsis dongchuanensis TaxID=1070866 RepID=UPI0031F9E45F